MLVEPQKPVFGGTFDRHGAAEHGFRFDQVGRAKGGTALFTLVAVGFRVGAYGAGTYDVAVGKKLSGHFIEVLFGDLFQESIFIAQGAEKILGGLVMNRRRGTVVNIEIDAYFFKSIF